MRSQGVPASPDGNVIRRERLDAWRLSAMPSSPLRTIIGVDPSDSGEGDACGIVAASLTTDGVVVVHRDTSAPMTPEAWARAAIELAQDTGASEIAIETFTAPRGLSLGGQQRAWPLPSGPPDQGQLVAAEGNRSRPG